MSIAIRLTFAEEAIAQLELDSQTLIRREIISQIEAYRDRQIDESRRLLQIVTERLDSLRAAVEAARRLAAWQIEPQEYEIVGGTTTYAVRHNLGRMPSIQVLNSSYAVDYTIPVYHDSNNTFHVVVPTTSYTGRVLYV